MECAHRHACTAHGSTCAHGPISNGHQRMVGTDGPRGARECEGNKAGMEGAHRAPAPGLAARLTKVSPRSASASDISTCAAAAPSAIRAHWPPGPLRAMRSDGAALTTLSPEPAEHEFARKGRRGCARR
jgi:hypothetical protein